MNDLPVEFVRRIEFRKYVATKVQFACREVHKEQLTQSHSCLVSPCNIQAYYIVLRFHLAFDGFSAQLRPFVCLLQPPRVMTDTARTVVRVRLSRERLIAGKCILPVKLSSLENGAFLLSRVTV